MIARASGLRVIEGGLSDSVDEECGFQSLMSKEVTFIDRISGEVVTAQLDTSGLDILLTKCGNESSSSEGGALEVGTTSEKSEAGFLWAVVFGVILFFWLIVYFWELV